MPSHAEAIGRRFRRFKRWDSLLSTTSRTRSQIHPEDRGQNYSIRMGEEVAKMVVEDHAARSATPTAAA